MKKEALIRQLANGPAVLEDLIAAIPPERIDECHLALDKVYENRRFIVYQLLN